MRWGCRVLVAAAITMATGDARAATITVDDTGDDGTGCQLREAIASANSDDAAGNGCADGSGADVIDLPAGTYSLTGGQIAITSELSVVGSGTTATVIDGNLVDRIFSVGALVTIESLTLQDGAVTGGGAAVLVLDTGLLEASEVLFSGNIADIGGALQIAAGGVARVFDCELTNNQAQVLTGGAINNAGELLVERSYFHGNSASGSGGAFASADSAADAVIRDSLFRMNTASNGGGLAVLSGTLELYNSTLSANIVTGGNGGGLALLLDGRALLAHVSLIGNSATNAGGFHVASTAELQMTNSLIASNIASGVGPDCVTAGTVSVERYNLVSSATGCNRLDDPSDILNGTHGASGLADNGGPTMTHALDLTSQARGAGDCITPGGELLFTDQRGLPRTAGSCTLGAWDPKEVVTTTTAEPAGANCVDGGERVDTGIDLDDDGQLDPDEITATEYVCTDPSGGELSSVSNEPAGGNCEFGGVRVDSGTDDDGDGVLDPGEVTDTRYVCDGADPMDQLVATSDEPPGANCAEGGTRIDIGIDSDDDGSLAAGEITSTDYVCDEPDTDGGCSAAGGGAGWGLLLLFALLLAGRRRVTLVLTAGAWMVLGSANALAATITVDGTTCLLSEAVVSANNDDAAGNGCVDGSGADVILVPDGTYTLSGALTITGPVTMVGASTSGTIIDGDAAGRIITVTGTGDLTLDSLTLTDGAATVGGAVQVAAGGLFEAHRVLFSANNATHGGAIGVSSGATARVFDCEFANNKGSNDTDSGNGGGIQNLGDLAIVRSYFHGNSAFNSGGALHTHPQSGAATTTVRESLFVMNTATTGGGLSVSFDANPGRLLLYNSTLSANTATGNGGGLHISGADHRADLAHVTIAGNSGADGGGINVAGVAGSELRITNSLVAGNSATGTGPDCNTAGTVSLDALNLVGDASGCAGLDDASNILGGTAGLIALADNHGPTLTHALDLTSAARGAGDCTAPDGETLLVDQRGILRGQTACTIGAWDPDVAVTSSTAEPAGANCPEGGVKIDTGIDLDDDGQLDAGEITDTDYVCTDLSGTNLSSVTVEPAGANCAEGGVRIDSGVDADGDGVLDAGEITDTEYRCDGADPTNRRVSTSDEPPGENCAAGGTRIDSGVDADGDGVLDASEITATDYVCATPGEESGGCSTGGGGTGAGALLVGLLLAIIRGRRT